MDIDTLHNICHYSFMGKISEVKRGQQIQELAVQLGRKTFSIEEAVNNGFSQPTISRLCSKSVIQRTARGIYSLPPETQDELLHMDFITACLRFGSKAYITGYSAFNYYDLVDAPGHKIWIAVSLAQRTQEKKFRLVRTAANSKIGIEDRTGYRIASIERTVLDGLHYWFLWGKTRAMEATVNAIRKNMTSRQELGKMAKKLGWDPMFKQYELLLEPEVFGRQ